MPNFEAKKLRFLVPYILVTILIALINGLYSYNMSAVSNSKCTDLCITMANAHSYLFWVGTATTWIFIFYTRPEEKELKYGLSAFFSMVLAYEGVGQLGAVIADVQSSSSVQFPVLWFLLSICLVLISGMCFILVYLNSKNESGFN